MKQTVESQIQLSCFKNVRHFDIPNFHIHNAFHYTSNCYIQLHSATSPASPNNPHFIYSVDWRVGGSNISYSHPNIPIDERTEYMVSYNVCAFKLGALWYVIIEVSIRVLKPFCLDKRQNAHWS